jgi:hypothetical protein
MPEITAINAPGINFKKKELYPKRLIISDTTVITTDPN